MKTGFKGVDKLRSASFLLFPAIIDSVSGTVTSINCLGGAILPQQQQKCLIQLLKVICHSGVVMDSVPFSETSVSEARCTYNY